MKEKTNLKFKQHLFYLNEFDHYFPCHAIVAYDLKLILKCLN